MLFIFGIYIFLSVFENVEFIAAQGIEGQKCYLPNEFYSCGGACQNTCVNLLRRCQIFNIRCNDLCYCNPGYSRDDRNNPDNSTCIPTWECFSDYKPICLGLHEEFLPEGSSCQTKCSRLGLQCPIVNKRGVPGCHCIPGYARDHFGTCIPVKSCPKERCPNDMYEVFTEEQCDKTCLNLGLCPSLDISLPAVKGCYCEIGYFRAPDGTCVQQHECPVQGGGGEEAAA